MCALVFGRMQVVAATSYGVLLLRDYNGMTGVVTYLYERSDPSVNFFDNNQDFIDPLSVDSKLQGAVQIAGGVAAACAIMGPSYRCVNHSGMRSSCVSCCWDRSWSFKL